MPILKHRNQIITLLSWTAVLLWMLVIFSLSSQAAEQSDDLSTEVTKIIAGTVEKVSPVYDLDIRAFNHIIRKNAHFLAYLVLGVLVRNALRRSRVKGWRACALALGICALYAVSDEVHQLFVPGRSGQVRDVLLDSAGAFVGIGVYFLASKIVK